MQTQLYGIIAARITIRLGRFVEQYRLGHVAVAVLHQTTDGNSLMPAVAFYPDISAPFIEEDAVFQIPKLAIEIKFPDESMKQMRDNAAKYLAYDCRIIWVIHPEKRIIEVHTLDNHLLLTDDDTLDGGDVLPGFTVAVNDLFPPKR